MPRGRVARVRSVQRHGAAVERSRPGDRTAIALAGIPATDVGRGDWLVAESAPWGESTALDVEISLEASAPRPLVARSRVRVHLGTAEILARVHPRAPITPGGCGLARLALEEPAIARGGDRLVLRAFSPVTTIGGGRVLDPEPGRRAPWPDGLTAREPERRLAALVARRRWGVPAERLAVILGPSPAEAESTARAAPGVLRVGPHWLSTGTLEAVRTRTLAALAALHEQRPADSGVPLETLRRSTGAPEWLTQAVLDALRLDGSIAVDGGLVRSAGFRPRFAGGADGLERLVALLEAAGLAPPDLAELGREAGVADPRQALRLAERAGRVVAVERERWLARSALERFAETLRELGANGTLVTPAALRDRLGLTRKYLIPLLEWADREGLTERHDAGRVVRPPRGPGHARGPAA
jgi:selenocysteine-specific elongation factor